MRHRIVLASSSPYRKQILARTQLEFDTFSPNIDESALADETPLDLVTRLSVSKARAGQLKYPDALIIGSDQTADLNGNIMGKPRSRDEAFAQLQQSSASTLVLYTGVALLNSSTETLQTAVDSFEVKYRKLSDEQIGHYLDIAQPYDCCGSLKAEGIGISLLKRLTGNDPNTLIGLPLIKLIDMLHNEGVVII